MRNVTELIPEKWRKVIKVSTDDELINLGSQNIARLIDEWEEENKVILAEKTENRRRLYKAKDQWNHDDLSRIERELKDQSYKITDAILVLRRHLGSTEEKPYLIQLRPIKDWVHDGDRVMSYIGVIADANLIPGTPDFVPGKADWVITPKLMLEIYTDQEIHDNKEFLDGHGLNCNFSSPSIMTEWEFQYFKEHPNFIKVWLDNSRIPENYPLEEFTKAFQKAIS